MNKCKCGSYAINENLHGRDKVKDLDLCDVCYWRKRAQTNPWHDAEKEKPEFQGNYFLELIDDCGHKVNDIGFFFHGEFLPCSLRKAYDNGILKVIRWMHIPKNEGEE